MPINRLSCEPRKQMAHNLLKATPLNWWNSRKQRHPRQSGDWGLVRACGGKEIALKFRALLGTSHSEIFYQTFKLLLSAWYPLTTALDSAPLYMHRTESAEIVGESDRWLMSHTGQVALSEAFSFIPSPFSTHWGVLLHDRRWRQRQAVSKSAETEELEGRSQAGRQAVHTGLIL